MPELLIRWIRTMHKTRSAPYVRRNVGVMRDSFISFRSCTEFLVQPSPNAKQKRTLSDSSLF